MDLEEDGTIDAPTQVSQPGVEIAETSDTAAQTPDSGVEISDYHEASIEKDLVTNEDDALAAPVAEDKTEDNPKAKPTSSRYLKDGTLEITREDGTKIQLAESEIAAIARKRIDKATAIRSQLERSMADMEAKHEAELAALRADTRELQQADKPWLAKGADKPSIDDFDDLNSWADARDEWTAAQNAPNQAQNTEAQALTHHAMAMMQDGLARYPDFDKVVKDNADAPFDHVMTHFLLSEGEDPTEMFYHYGQNVDDLVNLRQMLADNNYKGALRALAKAEARLETTDPRPAINANKPAQISKAPAPIRPITGGAPVTSSPENLSTEAYIALRRKQMANR